MLRPILFCGALLTCACSQRACFGASEASRPESGAGAEAQEPLPEACWLPAQERGALGAAVPSR